MSERLRQLVTRARQVPAGMPLRVRLVVALVLLVAVALTATGLVATTQLKGYLIDQVDRDLRGGGPPPAGAHVGDDDGAVAGDGDGGIFRSRPEWFQLATADASQLGQPQRSGEASPPELSRATIRDATYGQPFTVPARTGSTPWRVLITPVSSRSGQPTGVVQIRAISLSDVESTVHRLVVIETAVGALVLLLLGGLGYVVVRRSLRPLVEVEHTAAAIAGGDLSRRVSESDPRTEVGRLSLALNGMLAQIESAFRARERSEAAARASEQRMRRFVADASHELRTPLTSIRGFSELYRQGAATSHDDIARVMRRVEDSAAQMGVLVDDLLLLARLDQQRPLDRGPVDIVALAADAVHDAQAVAPDRDIGLEVSAAHAPIVQGDGLRLRQVLSNLLSNALTHTPAGTPVEVRVDVAPNENEVRIAVRDHGPGLEPADAERVFERFFRADASRTRAAGGTGLGLSIVAALVAAHGGQAGVDTAPGAGAVFWVRLPIEHQHGRGDRTDESAETPNSQAAHSAVTGS